MSAWTIDTFDALTAGDSQSATQTVLIITDALDGMAEIGKTLIRKGYRVQVALAQDGTVRGTPIDAPNAILVSLDALLPEAEPIFTALRDHFQSPLIPLIGHIPPDAARPDGLDSVLYRPCHPQQVAGRVDAMIRLQAMQHELLVRAQVLRLHFDTDHRITEDALDRPLRVLFIGKAKPEFMVVLNAMRDRNVEVVAAFTSFTAFDYLHGRDFDAIIMDGMDSAEPASSILSAMQRNVRMFHVPKIVMVRRDKTPPCPQELLDLATDIVSASDPTEEITNRILEPANYHRIHSQLREEFASMGGKAVRDPDTGLFDRAFLEAYLDVLAEEGHPRTVCVVRLVPNADSSIPEAFIRVGMAQAGGYLAGLVRINDLVARLSDDSFAIALPAMRDTHLQALAARIVAVLECAAFESGKKDAGPFTMMATTTLETDASSLPAATRVSRILAA